MTADTIRNTFLSWTQRKASSLVSRLWALKLALVIVESCCLVGVVRQRTLFIANLGNSRALLGKVGLYGQIVPEQLSSEHGACDDSTAISPEIGMAIVPASDIGGKSSSFFIPAHLASTELPSFECWRESCQIR